MFLKTKTGMRINMDFVVRIEELDRTDDGYVACLLKMANDEMMDVEVLPSDLYRLDNGA